MCFVLLWWALCWLISMHAWLSWKVGVVASNNFLQYVPQQQQCFLKPKQVTCIQFSQSWVKVSVVIYLPNWSTCHQRKKEILRCLSPRILIFNPINPRHSSHKASTQFSSNPAKSQSHLNFSFLITNNPFDNSPLLFFWIGAKPCNNAHCNCNIQTCSLHKMQQTVHTSLYGKFYIAFFSCCDCGLESLDSQFSVVKEVWTLQNLSSKNAHEPIETGKSSKFFHLYFDSCLFFSYPLEQASIFDVRPFWNVRLECLNNVPFLCKGQVVNMDSQNEHSPVIIMKEVKAGVLLWLFEPKLQESWMKQLVHSLWTCFKRHKIFSNSHMVPSVMRFSMRNDQNSLLWMSLNGLTLLMSDCSLVPSKHHNNNHKESKCCELCDGGMCFQASPSHVFVWGPFELPCLAPQDFANRSSLDFEHPFWPN